MESRVVLQKQMKSVVNFNARVPFWKRAFDICVLLMLLPVILLLGLLIALVIRLVSAGPVLFRQERVGHMGRKFMLFKFRTMYVGADPDIHRGHLKELLASNKPMTKMDSHGDRRIIPFGVLLRSSGLDELPQLINVFRGEMSLVGPRPCLPYEKNQYLHWQKERFNTLPGLTGLWQVSGKNNTTFLEMIQMDIEYSRRKTLWLDLAIISKTIPALLVQMWEIRRRKQPVAVVPQEPVETVRSISE
jgi:lipopolysaccharide/colanic/teichoic acid biosynthesis glycosyltransferase